MMSCMCLKILFLMFVGIFNVLLVLFSIVLGLDIIFVVDVIFIIKE